MNSMEIVVIISKQDKAGMNIASCLDEKRIEYVLRDEKSYNCENIDKEINADMFIFATKHESQAKVNSLSVHAPGNFGKAELGGRDRELCVAPAGYLKKALIELEKRKLGGFEVVQEVTHHGPYLEKPCMFIEIGSNEDAWLNKEAGKVIAEVIGVLLNWKGEEFRTAIGIGGLHHTPNFKKIILDGSIAIGHVCAKYNLKDLDEEMLKQMIERNSKKADLVILDWKGLGTEKEKIKKLVESFDLEIKRTKEIKN